MHLYFLIQVPRFDDTRKHLYVYIQFKYNTNFNREKNGIVSKWNKRKNLAHLIEFKQNIQI